MSHGSIGVALPFFLRRAWAGIVPRPNPAPTVAWTPVRATAGLAEPTVTWVGHSTMLVHLDGVTVLTDPIWSERASPVGFAGPRRLVPPGVPFESLPPIDVVVVSHSHYDHLDLPTLRRLTNGRTVFLVPLGLATLLDDAGVGPVRELDWWEEVAIGPVRVHCVPARHWSRRGLFDENRTLWSGWVVVGPRHRLYFAGDTGYTALFREIGRRLGPFDLAGIPIGAYEPTAMMRTAHLDPEEAVQAALDVRAHRTLGVHWGTFDLTDEPLDEPPARFRRAASSAGLSADDVWTFAVGETRGFGRPGWRLDPVSR